MQYENEIRGVADSTNRYLNALRQQRNGGKWEAILLLKENFEMSRCI